MTKLTTAGGHCVAAQNPKFRIGDVVYKSKGAQWHGTVVGTYHTSLTPEGYAVESLTEKGSVQIYPAAALEPYQGQRPPEPPPGFPS